MPIKGVVVVPSDGRPGWQGESPGTERVANRSLVSHALDALTVAGISQLAVVADSANLAAVRSQVDGEFSAAGEVTFLAQTARRDVLGALQAAAGFVNGDPAVAHLATGLLGQPLAPYAQRLTAEGPDLLMLVHHGTDGEHLLGTAAETLLGVTELRVSHRRLAPSGVCGLGPNVLTSIGDAFGSGSEPIDLVAIAEALAGDGRAVQAGLVRDWYRYSHDPLELLELHRSVLDRQVATPGAAFGDNRIEGRVIIDPSAEIESSVILGPSVIGAGARISHAYIGPYTSIGASAVIEGAEIERSIVAEGARIMHIATRIQSSTIGRRATIAREFGLPRAMRFHVGDDVQVTLD